MFPRARAHARTHARTAERVFAGCLIFVRSTPGYRFRSIPFPERVTSPATRPIDFTIRYARFDSIDDGRDRMQEIWTALFATMASTLGYTRRRRDGESPSRFPMTLGSRRAFNAPVFNETFGLNEPIEEDLETIPRHAP